MRRFLAVFLGITLCLQTSFMMPCTISIAEEETETTGNIQDDSGEKEKNTEELGISAESGIIMEVYCDCEGVQLYTGNFIEPHKGKNGAAYDFRHGFCLETQYYPDAVNQKNFKSPLVPANTLTESDTIFKFKV